MKRKLTFLLALLAAGQTPEKDELLWQHRNRGKAFYENPTTQQLAVDEFRKALALDPDSPRERLNYGLALLRAGKNEEGLAELRRVQQQDARLPHTWFNLGIAHKKSGQTPEAIAMFERMVQLVPEDAISHYNLGVLYKLENRLADAEAKFREAARLSPSLAAPHFQLYNAYRLGGKREEAMKELAIFQELKKATEASGNTEDMEWNDYAEVYDPIEPGPAELPAVEPRYRARKVGGGMEGAVQGLILNADGGVKPDVLVWNGSAAQLYLDGITASAVPVGRGYAAADTDNDGIAEIVILMADRALLYRKGQAQPLAAGAFAKAVFVDYDHDYDLDLLLLGTKPALWRNQGEAGFSDRTADFPFVAGTPVDAVTLRLIPDSKAHDVIVTYSDRGSVLYRDRLAGKYDAVPLAELPQGARDLTVDDFNHDAAPDVIHASGAVLNLRGRWQATAAPAVCRLCADFNLDGKVDRFRVTAEAAVLDENITAARRNWVGVRLHGIKNVKLAHGAEVEVRTGRRFQKQIYQGWPLLFDLGAYGQADTVRITWPNGLIQHEARQPGNRVIAYKEAQRLSGSCPMIFTWDGRRFTFLTDVLGVAPLGASSGEDGYFPTDHDEYVWIPGGALRERDGHYELRITEELGEVTYLDQLKLIAVDHPASTELYSNDKWKSPPFPEFRLFGTGRRIYPRQQTALARRDGIYAGPAARTMRNTASEHALELDFGEGVPERGAFLVLHGWVDWADGSTFRGQSQERGKALFPPYLQVRDGAGRWRTVIEDMGIPSGKTKTIAVDLSGKWLSGSRQVRIVTNLCVYWDEAFLGIEERRPETRLSELPLRIADLGFHGFSRPEIHPERLKPESFQYQPTVFQAPWDPTPGMYTRFGDVRPLLAEPDDMFVIMGTGDEIRLRFGATAPPLPAGWTRDYLLYVDGWAKDSDPNTAFSQTVEPLPFHRMSRYPYPAGEAFPNTPRHRAWREHYNKRPALRFHRPLAQR